MGCFCGTLWCNRIDPSQVTEIKIMVENMSVGVGQVWIQILIFFLFLNL